MEEYTDEQVAQDIFATLDSMFKHAKQGVLVYLNSDVVPRGLNPTTSLVLMNVWL